MLDVDAFLNGIKPAIYGNSNNAYFMKHLDQLKQYPYTTDNIDLFNGADFYLFFQNHELKHHFLNMIKDIQPRSIAFHSVLGHTLGYPPRSVEFFMEKERCREDGEQERLKKLQQLSITIYYCGCSPTSYLSDLMENVEWFWKRYHHESIIQIGMFHENVWKKDIHIPYQNRESLQQAYQVICERLCMDEPILNRKLSRTP